MRRENVKISAFLGDDGVLGIDVLHWRPLMDAFNVGDLVEALTCQAAPPTATASENPDAVAVAVQDRAEFANRSRVNSEIRRADVVAADVGEKR